MPRKGQTGNIGQTGPRFSTTEREGIIEKVAELDCMGFNQYDIANRVGVSQRQVCSYLEMIRSRCMERTHDIVMARIQERLDELKLIRREAWLAWEKSWENEQETVSESGRVMKPLNGTNQSAIGGGSGKRGTTRTKNGVPTGQEQKSQGLTMIASFEKLREIVTEKGRLPENEYLLTILRCIKEEFTLLGAYPEKVMKGELKHDFGLDWESMLGVKPKAKHEQLEHKINGVKNGEQEG